MGSYTTVKLLKAGNEVIIVDYYSNNQSRLYWWFEDYFVMINILFVLDSTEGISVKQITAMDNDKWLVMDL